MPILRNLRARRNSLTLTRGKRVTVKEVADAVGVDQRHLAKVERGKAVGSEQLAVLAAHFYGCEPSEFLPTGWQLSEGWDVAKKVPDKPPAQPQPKTTGPRKREQSDTKSPNRAHPESGAA
jgi:transcriptional regulator with XRE-family HTH domain